MADPTPAAASVPDAMDGVLGALADLLRSGVSPEVEEARRLLLRRVALEGDVTPSRVPAPRNITEVGGYLNLLAGLNQTATRDQMVASALGVAGPMPPGLLTGAPPPVPFVELANDRPAGPAQPGTPVSLWPRGDFAAALKAALDVVRADGCALPLLAPTPRLPVAGDPPTGDALLALIGRAIELVPGTLLIDPATDPLAVAILASDPAGRPQLVARELDGGTKVPEDSWAAVTCTALACAAGAAANARFRPLAATLAAAGWYLADPKLQPATASELGGFGVLRNVTGLRAGRTRLGDELSLLFDSATVTASALAGQVGFAWDGAAFSAPT